MPLNWNDEEIPSKMDKPTAIRGLKEIGGAGHLRYHPFKFAQYSCNYDGRDTNVCPVCKPGSEPTFPLDDSLTGRELLISLCNLAKVIDSFKNQISKEQLITRWCLNNMHPYSIDFIYSELTDNFDINSIDADLVERDGIFGIDRFMKDLEKLYNAVRFYVALEGILFAEDNVAYNLYEKGRYFERYSLYEQCKHGRQEATNADDSLETIIRTNKYIKEHPVDQPPKNSFTLSRIPLDDYNELKRKLVEFIPAFNIKLKYITANGNFEFSADIDSVFDIAWYTLARMISEDQTLENSRNEESRPEGFITCCRVCGKFIIRKSNRQEYCDAEECQKVRNARKQKAYRDRKASEKTHTVQKKNIKNIKPMQVLISVPHSL